MKRAHYGKAAAALFFFWSFCIPTLQAAPVPAGQDVGATVRREENAKVQKKIWHKLSKESQEKEQVEIEDEDILQPEATQKERS